MKQNFRKVTNPNFIQNKNNKTNENNNNSNPPKGIIQKVKMARTTSVLNISNMNLDVFPADIFDQNIKFDDLNWWDMVDIKKIDASNNKLTSNNFINNENLYNFSVMPALNYLKFSFNLFTIVPDSIYSLYNLKFLDFSNNKINFISENIKNLKNLVEINLTNNSLQSIPIEISFLGELEVMNLNQNKINQIPKNFGNLSKLKKLDMSENLIESISADFGNLLQLEQLIIFKNKIKKIEDGAFEGLINLKYLDLHNNFLTEFKKVPNSDILDTIILGYNKIEKLERLSSCPNLTVLDVNNNKIEQFSDDILKLKELKTLNLQNNSLNDIPPEICFLKKLVRINLEGNPLKKINSKYRSSNAEQLKAYLKTRLKENQIDENDLMDVDIDLPLSAQKINLQNNNILSYNHNNCLKMNNMYLDEIPIDAIKKSCNCKLILSLDFSENKINNLENLEKYTTHFPELKELKLSVNKIEYFPDLLLIFIH